MKEIVRIEAERPLIPPRKRVAAYCRVSEQTERLSHSLAAQTSYYSTFIQSNPEWEYAGVYADSFISGTKAGNRPELQRLIADCEAGSVDIILTKSISRFARNLVDLLRIVRRLKALGISVRFEKENIDTLTGDGELMLTILAGFAEEESKSISANVAWAARKRFKEGIPWHKAAFGYRWDKHDETFVVEPGEAMVVRKIYSDYLDGVSVDKIARRVGFSHFRVAYILQNEVYRGDVLLQKTFKEGPLDRQHRNRGELPSYYVSESHEAIIEPEVWTAVQDKIRSACETAPMGRNRVMPLASVFSGKIECGKCGFHYTKGAVNRNKTDGLQEKWTCYGKGSKGVSFCSARNITGDRIREAAAQALGISEFDEKVFSDRVEKIVAPGDDTLEFHLTDGTVRTIEIETYQPNQRSVSDPHKPFPGYVWTKDGYTIVPDEAEMVRMVFRLYAEGNSIQTICREVAAAGYTSFRGKASPHFISRMLDDERYTGRRTLSDRYSGTGREEIIENDHEPIIDPALYTKVQRLRAAKREKYAGRHSAPTTTEVENGKENHGTATDNQP